MPFWSVFGAKSQENLVWCAFHGLESAYIDFFYNFNKKSNLSSKLISRSKKLTSEQASWIFPKNYLYILRPGNNCSQVWHFQRFYFGSWRPFLHLKACFLLPWAPGSVGTLRFLGNIVVHFRPSVVNCYVWFVSTLSSTRRPLMATRIQPSVNFGE